MMTATNKDKELSLTSFEILFAALVWFNT